MRLHKLLILLTFMGVLVTPAWAQTPDSPDSPGAVGAETDAAGSPSEASESPAADAEEGDAAAPPGGQSAPGGQAEGEDDAGRPVDGATYVVRLRDLEQRIDELKEQIRRSHTRLSLLSDTILSGGVGGARAEISFVNNMSDAFQLTRLLVVLDGAVQYSKQDDSGALADQERIPIFAGSIPPGDHTVQVLAKLRGHGYGVFSYLRGYQFEVKSDHSFTVTEGKTMELQVVAYEKGGVTTPLEQRPAVRYEQKLLSTAKGPTKGSVNSNKGKASASGSVSVGTRGE